ncbi:MAG: ammonium transporter, partial [Pseudomonadota bacterium]
MNRLTILTAAGAAFALSALPAAAQEAEAAASGAVPEHSVFVFNTLLFLIGGFLVMWMAAGFAMLEAGLVRSKNVAMQCTKNISLFSIAALAYFMIGYLLMYPGDAWIIEGWIGNLGFAQLEAVGVKPADADALDYASTGSDFFFQLMFCATTASIVSGVVAERIKLWPFLIFIFVLTAIIYPIQASWKWGGGFLANEDEASFMMSSFGAIFQDFAGSTVVHSVGGWAALAGAIILGARKGKYGTDGRVNPMPGSNLPLATLGTFILWLG